MAKVLCVLYDDPVDGYPPAYARDGVPAIGEYHDGQTTPSPDGIDFTPGELLARETGQPAGRISAWREEFLAAGREGLKARPAPIEDVALREAQRKVGELSLEVDILQALLERKGHPQFPRRSG